MLPSETSTPKKSPSSETIDRFESRYAPLHTATIAWSRGPKTLRETPDGNTPRVIPPHAHDKVCTTYSVTCAVSTGTSVT